MAGITCPVECLTTTKDVACPSPDFVEKNGAWLLTVFGLVTGCFGTLLTYMLKSRCSKIKCWGVEVHRDVVKVDSKDVPVTPKEEEGVTSSNI
tara:strand:- start:580 stop:858 length:279 start_codon:yes stop_codon:yes gene_type:complete